MPARLSFPSPSAVPRFFNRDYLRGAEAMSEAISRQILARDSSPGTMSAAPMPPRDSFLLGAEASPRFTPV
jgi:hypothetical protein